MSERSSVDVALEEQARQNVPTDTRSMDDMVKATFGEAAAVAGVTHANKPGAVLGRGKTIEQVCREANSWSLSPALETAHRCLGGL